MVTWLELIMLGRWFKNEIKNKIIFNLEILQEILILSINTCTTSGLFLYVWLFLFQHQATLHMSVNILMSFDTVNSLCVCVTGYGFVDFDSPAAAQKAVTALKSSGVQAQMAKVRVQMFPFSLWCLPAVRLWTSWIWSFCKNVLILKCLILSSLPC